MRLQNFTSCKSILRTLMWIQLWLSVAAISSFEDIRSKCLEEIYVVGNLTLIYQTRRFFPAQAEIIQGYIQDYEDSNSKLKTYRKAKTPVEKAFAVVDNPVAAYRMTRRIYYLLPDLTSAVLEFFSLELHMTRKEMQRAAMRVANTVFDLNLNVQDMAEGKMFGRETGVTLQAIHCYELGKYASAAKQMATSVQFLELALDKCVADKTINSRTVEKSIAVMIKRHDEIFHEKPFQIQAIHMFNQPLTKLRHKFGSQEYLKRCLPNRLLSPRPSYGSLRQLGQILGWDRNLYLVPC